MVVSLLNGFRLPSTLEPYDGTTDPQEHLTMFNAAMLLSEGVNPIMCRSFPNILKNLTMLWFSFLDPNSIHDFFELATCFLTHFSTSQAHRKTSASLINLRQGEHKPLWTFLNRFNQEAIQIKDLSPTVSLHTIMTGLRAGPFADSLAWKPPSILDDLRIRVTGYINMDEALPARRATA